MAKNLIAVFHIYFVVMVIVLDFVPFAVQELMTNHTASMSTKMRPQNSKEMVSTSYNKCMAGSTPKFEMAEDE